MPRLLDAAIRARLQEKELNITQFAKLLGVSRLTVYNVLNGLGSADLLRRVSRALDIPLYALLGSATPDHQQGKDEMLVSAYNIAPAPARQAIDLILGIEAHERPMNARPSVLVVDDLQDNVDLCARLLRREFDVRPFTDPEKALESLKREPADVVITDQRMPGMTGTRMLIEVNAICDDITKVIVSAYSDNEAFLEAINRASVDAFILKPFKSQDLQGRVKSLLKARGWEEAPAELNRLS